MSIQEYRASSLTPKPSERLTPSPPTPHLDRSTKMIESLVGKMFRQMDKGLVPNIRNLTEKQREKLFSLTEGCYKFDDHIANSVLYSRQLQDLDLLYKTSYWEELELPPQRDLDSLSQDEIASVLRIAKKNINEMMKSAAVFGFPSVSQKSLLENPDQLHLLISLNLLSKDASNPQFLFSHKEETIQGMSVLFQDLQEKLREAQTASLTILGHQHANSEPLFKAKEAISKRLSEASSPEEFVKACTEAAQHAVSFESARQAELHAACQRVKTQFDQLSPYCLVQDFSPNPHELLNPPKGGTERIWAQEVHQTLAEIRPLTYLVEAVQGYLKPYLTGAIRPRDEDRSRPELLSGLIPKFRSAFPSSGLSDEEIERFVLSVYVKEGLRGINFHALDATSSQFARVQEDELAYAARASMNEHFTAYVEVLRHSLRIDFRSMNLTDDEVESLARKAALSTSSIVSRNWRSTEARPTER